MPNLKAIFFDAVGTLIHLPVSVGSHYRSVGLRHGLDLPESDLNQAFREVWKSIPTRKEMQGGRSDDDRDWWRLLVYGVLDRLLPSPVALATREEFFPAIYEHFRDPAVWAVYPETREVLQVLGSRYRLAIISNFDGRLRNILHGHCLLDPFQKLIISSEVGSDKPNPFIFEEALRRFGLRANEAIHVGDDPKLDWAGARAAGLAVFELNRPTNSLADLPPIVNNYRAA